MVKGYEFAKDQYVVFTAEELKALEEKATSTIDIVEFVPLARSIGSTSTRSTTSAPTREAIAPTGCWPRRSSETRPRGARPVRRPRPAVPGAAASAQRRAGDGAAPLRRRGAADERSPVPRASEADASSTLAKQLIDQTSNESSSRTKYKDTVRERVLEAIQRKVEGQDITAESQPDAAARSST